MTNTQCNDASGTGRFTLNYLATGRRYAEWRGSQDSSSAPTGRRSPPRERLESLTAILDEALRLDESSIDSINTFDMLNIQKNYRSPDASGSPTQ